MMSIIEMQRAGTNEKQKKEELTEIRHRLVLLIDLHEGGAAGFLVALHPLYHRSELVGELPLKHLAHLALPPLRQDLVLQPALLRLEGEDLFVRFFRTVFFR